MVFFPTKDTLWEMLQAVETASESENSDREGKSRYYIMYEKGKEVSTYQKTRARAIGFDVNGECSKIKFV